MLDLTGFSYVFYLDDFTDCKNLQNAIWVKLSDIAYTSMQAEFSEYKTLCYYNCFKLNPGRELYLVNVENSKYRTALSRFRLGCHNLYYDLFRQTKKERYENYCPCCGLNCKEDEYHLLLSCKAFDDLRDDILHTPTPNMYTFIKLMSDNTQDGLFLLAKFIFLAFERRRRILAQL